MNNNHDDDSEFLSAKGMLALDKRFNLESSDFARRKFELEYKSSTLKTLFFPLFKFLQCYLLKGGVLKGINGFILSSQKSYLSFLNHAKLYELQNANTLSIRELSKPSSQNIASNLSVYMIAQDEEQTISDALQSMNWAEELVVVDSGSKDNTVDIAKNSGANVFFNEWRGFPHQKQFALDKCQHEWVYSLDADEYITKELQDVILSIINQNEYTSLRCLRNDFFMGKPLSKLSKLPHNNRLFLKSKGKYDIRELSHENPKVIGKEKQTKAFFYHSGYNEISKLVDKLANYADLKAKERFIAKKQYNSIKTVLKFPIMLLKNLLINRYLSMGMRGYIFSVIYSYYAFQKEYMLMKYYLKEKNHE